VLLLSNPLEPSLSHWAFAPTAAHCKLPGKLPGKLLGKLLSNLLGSLGVADE